MMPRIETIGDCTLYLGDCREILPTLGKVDAVVTDPPYGIDWIYDAYVDTFENWKDLFWPVALWAIAHSRKSVFAVGSNIHREKFIFEQLTPKWRISWHKGSQGARCPIGFSDWEMLFVWGDGFGNNEKLHDFFSTAGEWPAVGAIDHPCPKPITWALWLIKRLSKVGALVCDPFIGSGTTGVACVKLGRKFIGIEIEPKYFDIACRRIADEVARPRLPLGEPSPKQLAWDEMSPPG